ncbi:MAG: hypothetical protein ACOX2A_03700 [Tepidanaerobacteraceae bacterium]
MLKLLPMNLDPVVVRCQLIVTPLSSEAYTTLDVRQSCSVAAVCLLLHRLHVASLSVS